MHLYEFCKEQFDYWRGENYWPKFMQSPTRAYLLNGDVCMVITALDGMFSVSVEMMVGRQVQAELWYVTENGLSKVDGSSGLVQATTVESLLRGAFPCPSRLSVFGYVDEGTVTALSFSIFNDDGQQFYPPFFSVTTPVYVLEGWNKSSFELTPSGSIVDGAAFHRGRMDGRIAHLSAEVNDSDHPVLWTDRRVIITGHEKWTGFSGPVTYVSLGCIDGSDAVDSSPADLRGRFGFGFRSPRH